MKTLDLRLSAQAANRAWKILHVIAITAMALIAFARAGASAEETLPTRATGAFATHCFSPYMTAARAQEVLAATGARVDFYDLDPFSNAAPSPVTGRAATFGTDRRCEVAFDGDHAALAVTAAIAGLDAEGIATEAPVPDRFEPTQGTALLAARRLNPRRIAVVHVGTRTGPNGVETFLNVERLMPVAP